MTPSRGGQSHASWRYAPGEQLAVAGYLVDLVATQAQLFGGDPSILTLDPNCLATFDLAQTSPGYPEAQQKHVERLNSGYT